jgi:uncharacterized protein
MKNRPDLEAGPFSLWLGCMRTAQAGDTGVDVPCGECIACCTSSYFIHIRPEETQTLAYIPAELLFPSPGLPKGHMVLGYDNEGRCPMHGADGCSIYEHRPLTCRNYDCRVFAAAGIAADRPRITQRAHRWAFSYPTKDDRARQKAVRAAAKFLQGHPECFTGGAVPGNPPHVAVLAVKVYKVFLERGDEPGSIATGSSGRSLSDAEIAAAVLEAGEEFEARRGSAHGER